MQICNKNHKKDTLVNTGEISNNENIRISTKKYKKFTKKWFYLYQTKIFSPVDLLLKVNLPQKGACFIGTITSYALKT